jgi:predicted MFS family arabinose efflux permease
MQELAQNWLVLEITGSAFWLGLDSFLGEIPILILSLLGGVVADRMDRRKLLVISQMIQMMSAFLLTVLIASKQVQIWHILVLSGVVGTAQAFGGPAYQALVPSLVDKEDLPNAIALNSIQFNLARVIGPVLGGLALTHLGAAWCFGLNGISFVAVIISLLLLHINFQPKKTGESMMESMKQGIAFIRNQGSMVGLIGIAFFMTALAIPMITFLPVFAKSVFQAGPQTYTYFLASSGVGSVAGALTVAALGHVQNKGRLALILLICLGAGVAAFALSKNVFVSCAMLFLSGAFMMGAFAMISSLVQLITANEMRGRVMSVYNVAFRGGMPLGSLVVGSLVPRFTAPVVIAVNGLLLIAMASYFLFFQKRVAAL